MDSTNLISEFIFGDDADIFKGNKIRVVNEIPKKVSLYDVMSILGDSNPSQTILRIKEKFPEVIPLCYNFNFKTGQGQRNTPVVDAKGLITILMLLPGEKAALFRYKASDILVRYLAGDTSLIPEIEKNNEIQQLNPDNFGFRDVIKDNSKLDKNTLPYIDELLTPTIIDTMLSPHIIYLLWIGYCHDDNVHVWKYGISLDIKDRSRMHKSDQKSESYIMQISLGTHSPNNLENIITKIVYKYGTKLNIGKESINREIFVTRNFSDLQDIINKIVKVANSDYFKKIVKDIRVAPGIISKSLMLKLDIERLKLQYDIEIAKKESEIKNVNEEETFNNILDDLDIDNLDLDEYSETFEDGVSDILDDKENSIIESKPISFILLTYPYDSQEQIDTLNEFIQRYCEITDNGKINKHVIYEAFNIYISPKGFLGNKTFYNKILKEYPEIKNSITCPNFFYGIDLKPGVIKDIYVYVRDFLHNKCDFDKKYRVASGILSNEFLKFIKDDLQISNGHMKKYGLNRNNFNTVLRKKYPFKFQYITQHIEGWCGIKLKSQKMHELSDLVKIFFDTKIAVSPGNHLQKRPVFHKFIEWYNETYISDDSPKSWTNTLFGEELNKYVKYSNSKWQNIKLI